MHKSENKKREKVSFWVRLALRKMKFSHALILLLVMCVFTAGITSYLIINKYKLRYANGETTIEPCVPINDVVVSKKELCDISSKFFKSYYDGEKIRETVSMLVDAAEIHSFDKTHYLYKMYRLNLQIDSYGGSINTRLKNEERRDIYKQIQDLLQVIGSYEGEINGDAMATFNCVKEFQFKYNNIIGSQIFSPEEYGIFGLKSLEAIRTSCLKNL